MDRIYVYTRKQAINDGCQFNIDSFNPSLRSDNGYLVPVFITSSVKSIIDQSLEYGCNDFIGVLHDILYMLRFKIKSSANKDPQDLIKCNVLIYWQNNRHKTFTFFAQMGALDVDDPSLALTIMTQQDL